MSAWFENYGFARVDKYLLVGAYPLDADDVDQLMLEGAKVVTNLTDQKEYYPEDLAAVGASLKLAGILEERFPTPDFGGLPADYIEQVAQRVAQHFSNRTCVYLHCRAGQQRSATVAAAALALHYEIDVTTALHRIQARKPDAQPLDHQLSDLFAWHVQRQG